MLKVLLEFPKLAQSFESAGSGSFLVHTDVLKVMALSKGIRSELLTGHLKVLEQLGGDRRIFFPTFNYEFTTSGSYDVRLHKCQVGALNEYARCNWADIRTYVPVFNFCGKSNTPELAFHSIVPSNELLIDPFSEDSVFHKLYGSDGSVVMYGAPFSAFTAIHYIERRNRQLLYRYNKYFRGAVTLPTGHSVDVTLKYHVRPLGITIDYDWDRLHALGRCENALVDFDEKRAAIIVIHFRKFCDLLLDKINDDPLFLLTSRCRTKVQEVLDSLGRGFEIGDFENPHDDLEYGEEK
jgi:aminoglycoside N3'-acetyltransferase